METTDALAKPLNDDEFVELGELLAEMPDPFSPMEADRMDGYLTAIALLPERIPPSKWMPFIFDETDGNNATLLDEKKEERLEELIYRRYRSIEASLKHLKPIDPIIYDLEDERGRTIGGWEAIRSLRPVPNRRRLRFFPARHRDFPGAFHGRRFCLSVALYLSCCISFLS